MLSDKTIHKTIQNKINNLDLSDFITQLSQFGLRSDGGVSREALSEEDIQARRFLINIAKKNNWMVSTDPIGNLFFRIGRVDSPAIMFGSHIDTQPVGGKLDGAYGVIAAIMAGKLIQDISLVDKTPLEIVIWNNEEGCRFSPGTMGSSAFVKPEKISSYLTSTDKTGLTLKDALINLRKFENDIPLRKSVQNVKAYLELHIEQGPVLENEHKQLGVVTGIQAVRWFNVTINGIAAHAGTTPMKLRKDALVFAHLAYQSIVDEVSSFFNKGLLLTSGNWVVSPNSINTIPDKVSFSLDVRCIDDNILDTVEEKIYQQLNHLGKNADFTFSINPLFKRKVTYFDKNIIDCVSSSCEVTTEINNLNGYMPIVSGAFHDAMYMADLCPTAMLFVPSINGISHNSIEDTSIDDLTNGLRAFTSTIIELLYC